MTPDDLTRWEQLWAAHSSKVARWKKAIAEDDTATMEFDSVSVSAIGLCDIIPQLIAEVRRIQAQVAASEANRAEIRRLQKMVGFSKTREHRSRCPGIEAWDVPGACSCDEPEVVRCKMCGARQRKDTPLEVNE